MTTRSILLLHSMCDDGTNDNDDDDRDSHNMASSEASFHRDDNDSANNNKSKKFAWQELQQTTPLVCNFLLMPEIPAPPAEPPVQTTAGSGGTRLSFRERRQWTPHSNQEHHQQQQVTQIDPLQLNPCGMDNVLLLSDLPAAAATGETFLLSLTHCRFDYNNDDDGIWLSVDPIPSTFSFSFAPQDQGDLFLYVPPSSGDGRATTDASPTSFAELSLAFDSSDAQQVFQEYHQKPRGTNTETKPEAPFSRPAPTPNATEAPDAAVFGNSTGNGTSAPPPQTAPTCRSSHQRSRQESLLFQELQVMAQQEEELLTAILRGMTGLGVVLLVAFVWTLQRVRRKLQVVEQGKVESLPLASSIGVDANKLRGVDAEQPTSSTVAIIHKKIINENTAGNDNISSEGLHAESLWVEPATSFPVSKMENGVYNKRSSTETGSVASQTNAVVDKECVTPASLIADEQQDPPHLLPSTGRPPLSLTLPVRLDFRAVEEKKHEDEERAAATFSNNTKAGQPVPPEKLSIPSWCCPTTTVRAATTKNDNPPPKGEKRTPFVQQLQMACRRKAKAMAKTNTSTKTSVVDSGAAKVADDLVEERTIEKAAAMTADTDSDSPSVTENTTVTVVKPDLLLDPDTTKAVDTIDMYPKRGTQPQPVSEAATVDDDNADDLQLSPCSKLAKQWETTKSKRRKNKQHHHVLHPNETIPELPALSSSEVPPVNGASKMDDPKSEKEKDAASSQKEVVRVDPTQIFSPFSNMPQEAPSVAAASSNAASNSTTVKKKAKASIPPLYISPYISPIELPSSPSTRDATPSPASTTVSEQSFLEDYW